MEAVLPEVCPQCDSLMKGSVCLQCGHIKVDETKDSDIKKVEKRELSTTESIFVTISKSDKVDRKLIVSEHVSKLAKASPVLLAVLLFCLFAASYFRFIYYTPEYISPLVLSAKDISQVIYDNIDENSIDRIPLTQLSTFEKTLELELELDEGNLEKHNFALFASPETALLVHAFNLKTALSRFFPIDEFEKMQETLDVSDDDLSVYFSNGFGVIFPDDNFDKWGFVIGVEDVDYAEERVDEFNRLKDENEGNDSIYNDYYVDVIKLNSNTLKNLDSVSILTGEDEDLDDEDEESDEEESVDEEEDEVSASEEESDGDKIDDDEIDLDAELERILNGEDEAESAESKSYLLVSTDKEFLDQMREFSEGVLPSLGDNVGFADAKVDGLTIGSVYIYRNSKSNLWTQFSSWVNDQYDYVGFDKILDNIIDPGIVFFVKDNKLKIITSSQ